jgi:hypothetical protein
LNDVLIIDVGSIEEWLALKYLLTSFCQALGMKINCKKSCLLSHNLNDDLLNRIVEIFGILVSSLDQGMKYLDVFLKPNDYRVNNWHWLLQKVEKKIGLWTSRWLSLGGKLVLVNSVLQNMLVYWLYLDKGSFEYY